MPSLSFLFLHIACVAFPLIFAVGTSPCVNIHTYFICHLPYPWGEAPTVCIYAPLFHSVYFTQVHWFAKTRDVHQISQDKQDRSCTKEHVCNYVRQNSLSATIKGDWDEMISKPGQAVGSTFLTLAHFLSLIHKQLLVLALGRVVV